MKKLSLVVITVFAVGFVLLSLTGAVSATPDREKVDICHATSSESNPFVSLTVAQDSVDGDAGNDSGQGDHYLNHPDDIIPPIAGIHSGLNWDAEGQAIWGNGCKPVNPTTTTSTSTSSTTSTTVPTTTTTTSTTTSTTAPTTTTTSTTIPRTTTTSTAVPTTTIPRTTTTIPAAIQVETQVEVQLAPAQISFTG
jgi:hypothetical protein